MGWKTTLGVALLSVTCAQSWAATLTVNANPATTAPGSSVSVAVNVTDAADLSGYGFALSYDTSLLRFLGFSGGAFLGSSGESVDQGIIDFGGPAGTTGYAYGTIVGSLNGVSGAGALGYFNFEALTAGTSSLTLSDVSLTSSVTGADGFPTEIVPVIVNGSVVVQADTPPPSGDVPEPASWMLIGVGLVAAGALRKRRVAAPAMAA